MPVGLPDDLATVLREVCLCAQDAEDEEQEDARVHVLAPFTRNVNSIKRHVRTRIYFTSESHIHSLMNILRHTELEGRSLLSEEALERFDEPVEFDYLTQIVFRLYECNNVCSLALLRTLSPLPPASSYVQRITAVLFSPVVLQSLP